MAAPQLSYDLVARLAAAEKLAEEQRARADAAERLAEEQRARAAAAEKEMFFIAMRAISSSSSSDTSSKVDVARRHAPEPNAAIIDRLLDDFPVCDEGGLFDEGALFAAWAAFRARHIAEWQQPRAKLRENRDVHPSIRWLLDAVVPHGMLRVWHDVAAPDDVRRAHVRPDFTLTVARDAAPSTIGALLFVEVKKPGFIVDAAYQACAFARRRVFKLCCEADARGEPLDGIFAYGAATDGAHVVVSRVASGAPRPGETYRNLDPCPVLQSMQLPLFEAWDFLTPPLFHTEGAHVPDGFRALWRLCASPHFLGVAAVPLVRLRVSLKASLFEDVHNAFLELGERLGCGGTSDVYRCEGGLEGIGGGGGQAAVVKVSRVATLQVAAEFNAERDALVKLAVAAAEGLVPTCVAYGERVSGDARARAGDAKEASPWPVLVLRPLGVALAHWVTQNVEAAALNAIAHGAEASSAAAAAKRLACADSVVHSVLSALEAAGHASLVHADVRPSNIVFAEKAVLVDWGLSRKVGARLKGCGVAAFADARIFLTGVSASPAVDVLAVLYTWLAIAFGDGCAAPWGEIGELGALFESRTRWISATAAHDARVDAVAGCIAALSDCGLPDFDVFSAARVALRFTS